MSESRRKISGRWWPLLLGLSIAACADEPSGPGSALGFSAAYDSWQPGPGDTCTPEIHNQYSVVGPDRLLYPTWHPPVDAASGCTFGHEHGRNPRGSHLYEETGDIPFGLALPADHVGYKLEWQNDVEFRFSGDAANSLLTVRCDVLVGLHQGSHGAGAFGNPRHELIYHAHCTDGTDLHITMITTIGNEGEFVSSCDRTRTVVLAPGSARGGGVRLIPDRPCVEQFVLVPEGERSNFGAGVRESWEVSDRIRTADGRTVVSFNPYFQVLLPSRYYDAAAPNGLARTIDACFEVEGNGDRAQGGACGESTNEGALTSLSWDDPRSAFNGAHRFVDINSIRISNARGPAIWYTDAFGKDARTEPFPGSIRQYIAPIDNGRSVQPSGPAIGRDRNYGGQGVHAPN